jgi:hypothetical protein
MRATRLFFLGKLLQIVCYLVVHSMALNLPTVKMTSFSFSTSHQQEKPTKENIGSPTTEIRSSKLAQLSSLPSRERMPTILWMAAPVFVILIPPSYCP